jgi:ABC-type phosphate transport system permease subunit
MWVRILFSFLAGAMIVEIIQTSYGEMPQGLSTVSLWAASLTIFLIISLVIVANRWIGRKNNDKASKVDVLDDL